MKRMGTLRALIAGTAMVTMTTAQAGDAAETVIAEPPAARTSAEAQQETEITADAVDVDFGNHQAVFTGNVRVIDKNVNLHADRMKVDLTTENEISLIEATGHVVIDELGGARRATAEKAVYDVSAGKVVLTGNPELTVGEHSMKNAEKITYYRDSQRIVSTGRKDADERPRIRFKSDGGLALPDPDVDSKTDDE